MENKGILRYFTNQHLSNSELVPKYNEMLINQSVLLDRISELEGENSVLLNRISDLEGEIVKLKKWYIAYDMLLNEKDNLENKVGQLEQVQVAYNTLETKHMELIGTYEHQCEITNIVITEIKELIASNQEIKTIAFNLLGIIDENKEKLGDNDYLNCMNYLKDIDDNITTVDLDNID